MSEEILLTAMRAEARDGTSRLRSRLSGLGVDGAAAVPRFGVAFANDLYDLICQHGGWAKPKPAHPWAHKGGAKKAPQKRESLEGAEKASHRNKALNDGALFDKGKGRPTP